MLMLYLLMNEIVMSHVFRFEQSFVEIIEFENASSDDAEVLKKSVSRSYHSLSLFAESRCSY